MQEIDLSHLRESTLKLSLVKGFGKASFAQLREAYPALDPIQLYRLEQVRGLSKDIDTTALHNSLHDKNVEFICWWEDTYPYQLKQTRIFPQLVYCCGNIELLSYDIVTIVGTRNNTNSAAASIKKILAPFKGVNNVAIASGMATGIDSLVHSQALINGLPTIAVLASSPDQPTPVANTQLYKEIIDSGGLVMSFFPPGTNVTPGMFAVRNELLAGIARSVIVVEAGKSSGALITARVAFEFDRAVWALPGNINEPNYAGCNELIRDNIARILLDAEDVLKDLSIVKLNYGNINQPEFAYNVSELGRQLLECITKGFTDLDQLMACLPNITASAILSEIGILEVAGILSLDYRGKYYINI